MGFFSDMGAPEAWAPKDEGYYKPNASPLPEYPTEQVARKALTLLCGKSIWDKDEIVASQSSEVATAIRAARPGGFTYEWEILLETNRARLQDGVVTIVPR